MHLRAHQPLKIEQHHTLKSKKGAHMSSLVLLQNICGL